VERFGARGERRDAQPFDGRLVLVQHGDLLVERELAEQVGDAVAHWQPVITEGHRISRPCRLRRSRTS
jgi:hypothetical protein